MRTNNDQPPFNTPAHISHSVKFISLVVVGTFVTSASWAAEVGMPPVAMGEVAAGILSGGGPNVSGFLTEITPKNPKNRGREFEFKVNGSGLPVKTMLLIKSLL
jgi:hypothetical protein